MNWNIKPQVPEEFQKQFPEYTSVVLQLLCDRGLKTTEDISRFFSSDYETSVHDPFLIKGMQEACERIFRAVEVKEKVIIVGDYDADGVCGLTILYEVLKTIGIAHLDTYIPDREREGYGLNMNISEMIADKNYDLVMTVDCGISDQKEIEFLTSKNINTIVVDHHLVPELLPPATVIVNPKQAEDTYVFKYLCATGLAYKVTQALYQTKREREKSEASALKPGVEKWLLDLVAIATIADVMPLLDENRVFVRYGLYVLSKTKRIGLKELMSVAGIAPSVISNDLITTNLNTQTVGFQIAPRINVASRMAHANTAFELLTTDSPERARELAQHLDEKNRERQMITEKIMQEIESSPKSLRDTLIFEYGEGWPVGVLGIVAGKLAEKYYVPTVVLSKKEEMSVGSARSIPPLNITEAIAESRDCLEEFGGHHQAAGLTLKNEHLEVLKQNMLEYISARLTPEDFTPSLNIDCELALEHITWALYDDIEKFAPFGEANPRPKFLVKNLVVRGVSIVGNGNKHLKLSLQAPSTDDTLGKVISAIGFGLGSLSEKVKLNDMVDVVAEIIINEWNGNRELQFHIVDIDKK